MPNRPNPRPMCQEDLPPTETWHQSVAVRFQARGLIVKGIGAVRGRLEPALWWRKAELWWRRQAGSCGGVQQGLQEGVER